MSVRIGVIVPLGLVMQSTPLRQSVPVPAAARTPSPVMPIPLTFCLIPFSLHSSQSLNHSIDAGTLNDG